MNPLLLAAVVALVSAAVGILSGSALISVAWRTAGAGLARLAPQPRAWLLVFIRLLPVWSAAVYAGLVVTAFTRFEPAGVRERPGAVLVLLAAGGAILIVISIAQGLRAWIETRRLVHAWSGEPRPATGGPFPIVEISTPFPVVAVVGIWRPRLFIARQVLGACTPGEVDAMIAHEAAHVSRGDNLTRLLFLCCPTIRRRSDAAAVEQAWTHAAEEAADDRARHVAPSPLLLASALTKVARLALGLKAPVLQASAILSGESVEHRVRRLLATEPEHARDSRIGPVLAAVSAGLTLIALTTPVQRGLYEVVELAVRHLP